MHDPEAHKTIEKLIRLAGGKEEALGLELLLIDDNQTLYVSNLGFSYLMDVEAGELTSPLEIYTAGFRSGVESMTELDD